MKRIRRAVLLIIASLLMMGILPMSAFAFDNTGWYWPVPDSLYMSRGFYDGHGALDIISTRDVNETIVASRAGTVIAVYEGCSKWDGYGQDHGSCNPVAHLTSGDIWGIKWYQEDGGTNVCNYGIGNGVVIDHGNGVWSEYSHMASVNVYVGQQVDGADVIGTMGSYGNSTGRHLHFSIKTGSSMSSGGYPNGTAVNNNAYGAEYIIYGSWNQVDNIWYSRDYASAAKVYLDVNSTLDGQSKGTLENFGTCDVYINDALVAKNVSDYYDKWPAGTVYRVTNIKAADGYSYAGEAEYTGTLASSDVALPLPFLSCGTLELKGKLDSVAMDDISGVGTCDVYVDGKLVADDVTSFKGQYLRGTSYRIENIVAGEGIYYEGLSTISGVIGSGTNAVELVFSTMIVPGAEWQVISELPPYIDLDACEIQYLNHYNEREQQESPGEGWTLARTDTTYVDGDVLYYEIPAPLEESDTLVNVGTFYYHYCDGSGTVEHYWTERFCNPTHLNNNGQFDIVWQGVDDADSRYAVYRLKWNSGEYAGGLATCPYGSSEAMALYYLGYSYLQRTEVTTNVWKKEAEWSDELDPNADSVSYRIRYITYENQLMIPGGVTEIKAEAFMNDALIQEVIVPDGCEYIGSKAFAGCLNLKRIYIPNNTVVESDAFEGCEDIRIIRTGE